MKYKAICIRCGTFKKDAFAACKECALEPKTDFEAARALILSEKTMYGTTNIGRTTEELEEISEAIKRGRPYAIDGEEQKLVVREYSAYLKSLPEPKWYQSMKIKWIVAGISGLAILMGIVIYVLRLQQIN